MMQTVVEERPTTALAARCFVCDGEVGRAGVPLLLGHTLHSHTHLPSKIGELLGDDFLVVVQVEDVLCKRCEALLNHLDQLQLQVVVVKQQLTAFLQAKYQLHDSLHQPLSQEEHTDVGTEDYSCKNCDDTEVSTRSKEDQKYLGASEVDELNGDIQCEDKVNVEIILEKNTPLKHPQRPADNYKCASCSFNAASLSQLSLHVVTCSQKSQFVCSMCDQSFSSNKGIQRHVMQQHLSTWLCHFCNMKFSEEHEYTSHLGSHLTSSAGYSRLLQAKQSKCSDGGQRSTTQPAGQVRQHYKCGICEYRTTNKQCFDEHVRGHVFLKLFKCEDCGNRFINQDLLMKHLKSCPGPGSSKCSYCAFEFASINDMADHMKSHNAFKDDCSADGAVLEILGMHNSISSELGLVDGETNVLVEGINVDVLQQPSFESNVFQCNVCSKTFISKVLLDDHVKSHIGELSSTPKNLESSHNFTEKVNTVGDTFSDADIHCEKEQATGFVDIFKECNEKHASDIEGNSASEIAVFTCFCGASFSDKDQQEKHKIDEKHFEDNDIFKAPPCIIKSSSIPETSLLNDDSDQVYEDHMMQTLENLDVGEDASIEQNGLINIISCDNEDDDDDDDDGTPAEPLNEGQYVFDVGIGENITDIDSEEASENVSSENLENGSEMLKLQEIKTFEKNLTTLEELHKKAYLCAVCGYRSLDLDDLGIHFRIHKVIKSNSSLTRENFSYKRKIMLHLKNENASGTYICLQCSVKFDNRETLQKHILDSHPTEQYCCSICDQKFTSRKALKIHEEIHSDKLLYKCDSCSLRFSKEKQLKHHRDMIHRDPHCRYCGKEILKAQTLKNHELRHAREAGNYECDVCKRVFKTKTGLRHHVAIHTGDYKFCCDYCGRGFMSRMMMEEHRSMHTKEERYICDVCGRKFSFQSTYWIHRKWHDTPYPYKCNFCGRMFRHSSLLAVHKRKHTGERPYKCPQCSLSFPVGGTLKRHMILHTGMYPFNCERCKRGFTTKHKYASHLAKVHADYDLLNNKPLQNDYKMVVRDEAVGKQAGDVMWRVPSSDGTEQKTLDFKLSDLSKTGLSGRLTKDEAQCAEQNSVYVDSIIPTRVVEIVLGEGSQAMATVTLAEQSDMIPELWYQQ